MFKDAEKARRLEKAEYRRRLAPLRVGLLEAQWKLRSSDFPVLIVLSGMDGAGKGETLNLFYDWMDPHGIQVHSFADPTDEERERPFFWRFWRTLPAAGTIGIYAGSWYSDTLAATAAGTLGEAALAQRLERIRAFEKLFADDGALIIKLWLHLGEQAQRQRLKALAEDPQTAWRVTDRDRRHLNRYRPFKSAAETILRQTHTDAAPWSIIDAADARYRNVRVAQLLLQRLRGHLERRCEAVAAPPPREPKENPLQRIDLSPRLRKPDYKRKLAHHRARLGLAAREAARRGISSIVVLEGRDAGGKGGIIRRMLRALDPRFYTVVPVGPPSDEERAHHYLWRFWRHVPRAGHSTIYDRSWYGRVLVERVENLAPCHLWMRAYDEINEFESQLHAAGIVLVKFWLEISRDEQLRRFEKRERVPFKRFKITQEDYRNRAHWDEYSKAAAQMIQRTSTKVAPWTLIAGDDKRSARIEALRTYCERLQQALGR